VTSVVATLTYTGNVASVANPSTYSRPAGYPLNIPIACNLATNWSDADADVLALTSSISSTNLQAPHRQSGEALVRLGEIDPGEGPLSCRIKFNYCCRNQQWENSG
jgi:hypothetical protein